MALPQRDALRHTYAEYLTWPEGGRYELISGTAYVKEPPAPSPSHQELVGELHLQLRLALEGKSYRPYIAPFDVRLPRSGEADELIDTVVQPDVRSRAEVMEGPQSKSSKAVRRSAQSRV
jgi:hypothetical protein